MSTGPNECSYCGQDHGSNEHCPELDGPTGAKYATVSWSGGDVQTLRPELTDEQAEGFLQRNGRRMADRMIEVGWDVMQTLLDMDEELPEALRVGSRVFWTDPDAGLCSGPGTVIWTEDEPVNADTVITVQKDDGGQVEANAHELRELESEEAEHQREMDRLYPVPAGLRRRPGVEAGCGKADCADCYEPAE